MGQLVGRVRTDPKFNFTPPGGEGGAVRYKAVLTCTSNPIDGATLTIEYSSGTTIFTFLDTPSVETDVQIGATADDTMTNLAAAMTAIVADTNWVAVFTSATKEAGAVVSYILSESSLVSFAGSGRIKQSSLISSAMNADHRRYVEATVEDADGNANGMLWVKIIEDVSGGGGAVSRIVQTKNNTVGMSGGTEDLSLNTGGGVIRFIAANGDAPTGVLFICTEGESTLGLPILPRESYEIDASVKSLYLRASVNSSPYTLCYLVNA